MSSPILLLTARGSLRVGQERCTFGILRSTRCFSSYCSVTKLSSPRRIWRGSLRLDAPNHGISRPSALLHLHCRPFSSNHGKLTENDPEKKSPLHRSLLSLRPRDPHERIWNLPNTLTFSRLLAAPGVGYLILTSHPLPALLLFTYASITDFVDGYLARRLNQRTVVGTVIDPMADKALMTISVVCLALQNVLPLWLAGIILARDAGLAVAAVVIRYQSLPEPKTVARFWDFSLPSAEAVPSTVGKINTFLQLVLVGGGMVLPVLGEGVVQSWGLMGAWEGFGYVVAGTTVWSGVGYALGGRAYKVLGKK